MSYFTDLMIVLHIKKIAKNMRDEEIYNEYLEDMHNEENEAEPMEEEMKEMGICDIDKSSFWERHFLLCMFLQAMILLVFEGGIIIMMLWPILKITYPFLVEFLKLILF